MGKRLGGSCRLALLAASAAAVFAALGAVEAADATPPALLTAAPEDGAFFNATVQTPGGAVIVNTSALFTDVESALTTDNVSVVLLSLETGAAVEPASANASYAVGVTVKLEAGFVLGEGRYRLEWQARDDAGNAATFTREFTVDLTRPQLEVAAPALVRAAVATVRIDARDSGSGLVLPIYLTYRSGCGYSWSTQPFEVTALPGRVVGEASFTLCVGPSNQFTVVVRDAAGNAASVTQRKIAYDVSLPGFSNFSPASFARVEGPHVAASVEVRDDAAGVNRSRVEYQVSEDGGATWGSWSAARVPVSTTGAYANVSAFADLTLQDGGTVAIRWRAWDLAGNGPGESRVEYFYTNGAPFVVAFEPAEGTVVPQYSAVRLWAEFADPDADSVLATFRSDLDGPLGRADGKLVPLSLGVHNLTLTGYDGHGHWVNYTYQIEVAVRPPPDPRPLLLTGVLVGAMVWAALAAWTREREGSLEAAPPPKA